MSKGFWIGLFIGGLVGAGLGVFLAPQSGQMSRRGVSDVVRSAGGKVAGLATSVQGTAVKAVTSIRQAI